MSAAATDSFIEILKKSGLIPEGRLQARLQELGIEPQQLPDQRSVAKALIDSGDITAWQAEKLLNGKHKGFFLGKYKLLRLLGRGGMSAVYLAEHVLMKRRCAIKVLPTNRVNDSSYLGRFHLEAQAAAALDDPNIVRAYDVDHFVDGKTEVHFLVMEYVEGRNLHDLVAKQGPLPALDAAEYIRQSAVGLAHAHQAGLVHRDIKPGNLLLDLKGTVKILDMGLARFFNESDDNSLTIEHDERVLGTADFLAPEQAINSHNVDARADIYSLGCTLYYLLSKHAPFEQGSLAQRLMAHQTQEPPGINTYRQDVPESLLEILKKMMAKKADDRYQSARDVATTLKAWIAENADEEWIARHANQWDPASSKRSTADGKEKTAPPPGEVIPPSTDEFGDFLTMIGKETSGDDSSGFSPSDSAPRKPSSGQGSGKGRATGQDSATKTTAAHGKGAPDSQSVLTPLVPSKSDKQRGSSPANKPGSSVARAGTTSAATPPKAAGTHEKTSPRPDSSPRFPGLEDSAPPAWLNATSDSPTGSSAPPASPAPSESPGAAAESAEPWNFGENSTPVDSGVGVGEPASHSGSGKISSTSSIRSGKRAKPSLKEQCGPWLERARELLQTKGRLVGAIAGGLLLLIGLAVLFTRFGGPATSPDSTQTTPAVVDDGSQPPAEEPTPQVPEVGLEITIGPGQTFTTLNQAFDYLLKFSDPLTTIAERKIEIAAGVQIKEPLKISNPPPTFPKKIRILSQTEDPVVWVGNGSDPLLQLREVQGISFENITFDAAGADAGIVLEGSCPGIQLRGSEVQGFREAGVQLLGAAGLFNAKIRLDNVRLHSEHSGARGVQILPGDMNPVDITIERCRFIGPLATGISSSSDFLSRLEIRECRFHEVGTALDFHTQAATLNELVIANNTFHNCGIGVRLQHMPSSGSRDNSITRNLFVGSTEVDLKVQQGFDSNGFQELLVQGQKGSGENWTTRPPPAAESGFNLFAAKGRTEVSDLKFQSTDPSAGNFLKPAEGQGKLGALTGLKPHVGAIPP